MLELICPICGTTSKKKKFINFFCEDCWIKQKKIKYPEKIILQRCKCGKIKIKKWNLNMENIKNEIASLCKNKFKVEIKEITPESCKLTFIFDDIKIDKEIAVEVKETLCEECTKKVRGYYEAIIQIRKKGKEEEKEGKEREEKKVKDIEKKLIEELEKNTFISKIKEEKYGVDIYVGSTMVAYEVLHKLGLRYISTKKLFTRKKGKNLYRTTFLVSV